MEEYKNQTPEETQGTEVEETTEKTAEETVENPIEEKSDTDIDYKVKFSESTRENQRILQEQKEKDAEIERLRAIAEAKENNGATYGEVSDPLYPGFESLSEEEQANLIAYTDGIKRKALEEIYKDPALASARESYNEKKWDKAFEKVITEFPQIQESKEEFKSKYYDRNNVPDNIEEILTDLSKVYLFDKAKDLGAKEAIEKSSRIEVERATGGDKTPKATRSEEDWFRLAQDNPKKFAEMSKEFNEDLQSGKLK